MRSFDPGSALGPRLREVREQRGLSVRELARRVGCSASLISQIERGVSAPSSGMVYLLAVELRASLDYLFDAVPAAESGQEAAAASAHPAPLVTRAADAGAPPVSRAQTASAGPETADGQAAPGAPDDAALAGHGIVQRVSSRRAIDLASGVRWERLTPRTDSRVDFLEVIYEPGGRSLDSGRFIRHDGYEYGVVISGRLRVDVGFEVYHLDPGDSIAFESTTPHQYWNENSRPVHAIWVVVHSRPGLA